MYDPELPTNTRPYGTEADLNEGSDVAALIEAEMQARQDDQMRAAGVVAVQGAASGEI